MYDKILDTFTNVADCGSFSKAAERMYLTHTAVIKQINTLEKELDVTLFDRTSHGVSLTAAGHVLYEEAEKLRAAADSAVRRVRDAAETRTVLRIGSSPLSPCQPFLKLWSENAVLWPQFRLEVVPFTEDTHRVERLGTDFDLFIGPFNARYHLARCRFYPLGSCAFHIAVPQKHRLAGEKELTLKALRGETLCIMKRGVSPANDAVREKALAAGVQVEDIQPNYDMQTFNRCAESGKLLLSLSCWADVHPGLCSVPLCEDAALPYGIVAAGNIAAQVEKLLSALPEGALHA